MGHRAYDVRVFVRLTGHEKDVGPLLLDAAEGLGGPRDSLVDHDDLHLGIVGEADDLADGGLHLGHEVVGIGDVLDHPALRDVPVGLDQGFGAAEVVLRLRNGPRDHSDVERRGGQGGSGHESQQHERSKQE